MSRKLSKIMVICALAAIIPLMIVGVAFASYYSIGKTIEVDSYTDYAAQGDAYASVVYNNDVQTSFSISDSHMKKVELTASSTGYDFQGWFAGSKSEYVRKLGNGEEIEFVSEDKTISFGMEKYEKVLAVFSVKEYAVTYKQDAAHGIAADSNENLMYGKQLLVPENDNPAYDFVGWKVAGQEDVYTNANFGNDAAVELVSVWKDNAQVNVHFYDGETEVLTAQGYEKQTIQLPEVSDIVGVEAGYAYAWTDAQGNEITEMTVYSDTNVYVKKEAIVYNLTISEEDIEFAEAGNINFTKDNIEDVAQLFNASNWSGEYSFYKLGEISYNNNVYANADALVAAIISANPTGVDGAVEVAVSAHKYFSQFNSGSAIVTKFVKPAAFGMWQEDGEVFVDDDWTKGSSFALQCPAMTGASSSMKVVEIFDITNETNLFNKDGDAVTIAFVKVVVGGTDITLSVDANTTIEDVIEMFVEESGAIDLEDTFSLDSITLDFVLA